MRTLLYLFIALFGLALYSFLRPFLTKPLRPAWQNKYFLTVLTIFKNEEMAIENWLRHYIEQGVQHVYLIDNNSSDSSAKLLVPWIERGLVTYHFAPERHRQMRHIREFAVDKNLEFQTEWLIICDVDEYFFGTRRKLSTTIRQHFSVNYDIIYTHWLIFGYSERITHPVDVRVSNVYRRPGIDECKKYIFRPNKVDLSKLQIHLVEYPSNMSHRIVFDDNLIHLNHYRLQSLAYFNNTKMKRGDVHEAASDNLRSWDYFWAWNHNTTFIDKTLQRIVQSPPSGYHQ